MSRWMSEGYCSLCGWNTHRLPRIVAKQSVRISGKDRSTLSLVCHTICGFGFAINSQLLGIVIIASPRPRVAANSGCDWLMLNDFNRQINQRIFLMMEEPRFIAQGDRLPVSRVNPRSLSSVVVNVEHSAIVIPCFLPARGQRQLRAFSSLVAAHPRHSVGMVEGDIASARPPAFSPKNYDLSSTASQTFSFCDLNDKNTKQLNHILESKRHRLACIHYLKTFAAFSWLSASVLHVCLLDSNTSFRGVHIRAKAICIRGAHETERRIKTSALVQ